MFFRVLAILSCANPLRAILLSADTLNTTLLKCISMTNQECKVRPKIVNVNSDEPVFYPFSIKTSKCSGSCNNINDPYAKICVPDVVKDLNVKVFNLMSRTNETKHIKWHETCKCKCRLDASICSNKQHWNDDKCRCECNELIDKSVCDEGYILNPSNCECECKKSCDAGEYLDYENCKCKKKLIDKLAERSFAEECTENIDEVKIADENECVCYKLCCTDCNSLSNQHWNWYLFLLILAGTEQKMLLILSLALALMELGSKTI